MQKISYNDIDFSKLKKLDVKSFENYIYVDDNKKNIYKILKEEDFGKLQDKSLKLDLLEEKKDATNISIPKLKIEKKDIKVVTTIMVNIQKNGLSGDTNISFSFSLSACFIIFTVSMYPMLPKGKKDNTKI